MKTLTHRYGKSGFVSYLMVLSAGVILLLMTLFTYRQAMASHEVAAQVNLRNDYSEKEDAILRSIIAITPNRAMRAMQTNSNLNSTNRNPLRWQDIFNESLDMANARTSVSASLKNSINLTNVVIANSGDSALTTTTSIFGPIATDTSSYKSSYCSAGINRSLGAGYPPPLETSRASIMSRDELYPIISTLKKYGNLAQASVGIPVSDELKFNVLKYPQINFGYAKPGDNFVAKQNWWAFSMELAGSDNALTKAAHLRRNFVLSIYEIPSQLAISTSSFMSLGQFGNGESWGSNVSIAGGVFAGKAVVEGQTALDSLAVRRGMTLSSSSSMGGKSFTSDPFAPGVRETYQVTDGDFFPVSLASESGRVAFVPINRGTDFFDRLANGSETTTLSPTTWNNYSSGALQCAMRLDITDCVSAADKMPTKLRFSYLKGGARQTLNLDLVNSTYTGLAPGYIFACNEDQTYNFGNAVVDLAYGRNGTYVNQTEITGMVTFNDPRFFLTNDNGTSESGYYKPSYPFEVKQLPNGKYCIAVYPSRIAQFLEAINADDTSVNSSLVVNVDYTVATGSTRLVKPSMPCSDLDYGLILKECSDLTTFTKGFSLVTNLRTYIGDDFNTVSMSPPSGYNPTGAYYPPCSLFMPEKRYGVESDPYAVNVSGQIGSLASDTNATPVRPLDSKAVSGSSFASSRITVNLSPITHPAELPPITMMNWLITISEVRNEFTNY